MRIVIAGTSNSVMRSGYVAGLIDAGHEIVANPAMGISHSVALPFMLDPATLATADVLVMDFCVNEQRATRGGMIRIPLIRDALMYARLACERSGAMPVALILPLRHMPDGYHIASVYRDLCGELGIPFFDGHAAMDRLGLRDQWADQFRDNHHLHAEVARKVGALLGEWIAAGHDRGEPEEVAAHDLTFVPVEPTIVRETSIMRVPLARMVEWEGMTLRTPVGDVVGIIHNASRSSAAVAFGGRPKRLFSEFHDPSLELRLVAWQVLDPVPTDGTMRVSVVPDADDADVESSDYHKPGMGDRGEPVAELAGFVVRPAEVCRFPWRPWR
jgi:hypothetical protein